jgi:lipopolysaccharide transport system ATP-binding protein
MSTVIKVENLSKQYRLGLVGTGTFKEDTKRFWAKIRGKEDPYSTLGEENDRTRKGTSDFVWSLRNINFEVQQGDVLGIIGKNGAGKSTLLKILSKVTTPTTGSVKAKGRIASLLEVGTGFHPELTGRENIYLNGAILGMRKHEITSKLDEIIAFSGVERYIDTPVKRYSSGMYVRLAFAVAAHLENEILIIDEVLAVGDADFQKKCLGKIGDVSRGDGRTVLFVSHNMAALKSLCKSGIFLENGNLEYKGTQSEVINFYQKKNNITNAFNFKGDIIDAPGNNFIKILSFEVNPLHGDIIQISSGLVFEVVFFNFIEGKNIDVTFELSTLDETPVYHGGKIITNNQDSVKGMYKLQGVFPQNLLNAGNYKFKLIFGENQRIPLFVLEDVVTFEILNEAFGSNTSILPGIIRPNLEFTLTKY